jgi:group I intron endonuclease
MQDLKESGVYKIYFEGCEKVYIGSSNQFSRRKANHFSQLRKGAHSNIHLQRAFRLFGESKIRFEIIEYTDIKTLRLRETFWIKYFNATNDKFGYNFIEDAVTGRVSESKRNEKRKTTRPRNGKLYFFVNPKGDVVKAQNLYRFCKENHLDYAAMTLINKGTKIQHKGWTKFFEDGRRNRNHFWGKDHLIKGPDGKVLVVNNITEFYRKNNIRYGGLDNEDSYNGFKRILFRCKKPTVKHNDNCIFKLAIRRRNYFIGPISTL